MHIVQVRIQIKFASNKQDTKKTQTTCKFEQILVRTWRPILIHYLKPHYNCSSDGI